MGSNSIRVMLVFFSSDRLLPSAGSAMGPVGRPAGITHLAEPHPLRGFVFESVVAVT